MRVDAASMEHPDGTTSSRGVAAADAVCARLAREHYENFPVASRLLPRRTRPHVAALYAFARIADDFADEGTSSAPERLARLAEWHERLHAAAAGSSWSRVRPPSVLPDDIPAAAVFTALGRTIVELRLPVTLFDDLLSAFRQDVEQRRYESWAEVMDYCRRSANPVGRLVLRIFGWESAALDRSSDALCSALQLTNFWQDLAIDWARGRLYVPREIWEGPGADVRDLDARRLTDPWREALREAAARTRQLYGHGRAVCDGVHGRLRWQLRATWLGGMAILDRLEEGGFDVFANRPRLARRDVPRLLVEAAAWRAPR